LVYKGDGIGEGMGEAERSENVVVGESAPDGWVFPQPPKKVFRAVGFDFDFDLLCEFPFAVPLFSAMLSSLSPSI